MIVKINGVDYTNRISNGYSWLEKLDYDLDEGSMTIPFSKVEKPFDIWDTVDFLEGEEIVQSFAISLDKVTLTSKNPKLFRHEIQLIEHTKRLERYTISGLTFTQPLENDYPQYTMLDAFERIATNAKTRLYLGEGNFEFPIFNIPETTRTFLDGVIAPEFSFKEYNVREALNELSSVFDGVVRMDRDFNIFIDLFNTLGDEIVDVRTTKQEQTLDAIEYATTLVSEILNPTEYQKTLERRLLGNALYPLEGGYVNPRSSTFIFSPDDMYIPTPNRIYKINTLETPILAKVTYQRFDQNGNPIDLNPIDVYDFELVNLDLAPFVVEKRTREILEDVPGTFLGSEGAIHADILYKQNTFNYVYGEKNINISEKYGLNNIFLAIVSVLKSAIIRQLRGTRDIPSDWAFQSQEFEKTTNVFWRYNVDVDHRDGLDLEEEGLYQLRYTTIPRDLRVEIDRDDKSEINKYTELMTNQKSRIVDTNNYLLNVFGIANQKGSSDKEWSQRVSTLTNSLRISDFTEDKRIITNKEVIVFRDHIRCNYKLNKNFNKASLFEGINSEVRQWEVGERGRTLDRTMIFKEYILVDNNDDTDYASPDTMVTINPSDLKQMIGTTFDTTLALQNPINAIVFEPYDEGANLLSESPLSLPIQKNTGGKSIIFSYEFEDNVSIGVKLVKSGIWGLQTANEFIRYTDQNGRIKFGNYKFYNIQPISSVDPIKYPLIETDTIFGVGSDVGEVNLLIMKDNREILKGQFAYQFTTPKEDFIIGEEFIAYCGLVSQAAVPTANRPSQLRLYTDYKFRKTQTIAPSADATVVSDLTWDTDKLIINNEILNDPTVASWALTDVNGNIWFARNNRGGKFIHFRGRRFDPLISYDLSGLPIDFIIAQGSGNMTFNGSANATKFEFQVEEIDIIGNITFDESIDTRDVNFQFEEATASVNMTFEKDVQQSIFLFDVFKESYIENLTFGETHDVSFIQFQYEETDVNENITFNEERSLRDVSFQFESATPSGDITFNESNDITPLQLQFESVSLVNNMMFNETNNISIYQLDVQDVSPSENIVFNEATSITTTQFEYQFDYLGTTTQPFDTSYTYAVQGADVGACPSSSQVTTWINANYDPETEGVGNIIRVQTVVVDGGGFPVASCNSHYYEVVFE